MLPNSILPTDKHAVTEFQTQVLVFDTNGNSTLHYFAGELETAGIAYEVGIYAGAPHAFSVFGPPSVRGRRLKTG
ncbi:MAG: hypothetical protein ACTH5D_04530 [Halomonas sp.]|uniref:hypothetical protein n=1 Tax=Halomonas sp. TaxID=1486246 RepID=UPI003F90E8DC